MAAGEHSPGLHRRSARYDGVLMTKVYMAIFGHVHVKVNDMNNVH